ncbi:MAG: bifunctional GNAT family N-acetyltransferase/carbon-nitrogen hydrolase family protein [Deltaproteobacteria bacterium]|jgi:predicted amidohydrolase/GNAT superfamily N-acetyltransferase|nr:bifunctional GNAT family N-acetyltransferase/carbon-nitrogen hydrolase family protein [Deltaproteobacteria bacterium]
MKPTRDEGAEQLKRRKGKASGVKVRRATLDDIPGIYACQLAAYPTFPPEVLPAARELQFELEAFPDGQLVAVMDDEVIGYASSLIVQLDDDSPWYSWGEITGNGTFSTHTPSGDTLYGADIAVHPDYRGLGVSGKLYQGRKRILKRFNLRRMVAGGRIPGYREHAGSITPEQYVARVIAGELRDPSLNAHLRAGYTVRSVHMGYSRDEHSLDYATFLEYENPSYRSERRQIAAAPLKRPVRRVRVCAAQYEMRRISSWEEFEQQVDFFIATAEQYNSHFLVFPELFTAQLFSMMAIDMKPQAAIRELAKMADRYKQMFIDRAEKSGLFIIGGSHPVVENGEMLNVAHLFTPSGNVYTQHKLHITPNERDEYGIQPGHGLHIFDTGHARIAILVCYDIEFPELARILTLAGAEILFVPFSTDERKAYLRVRYTSQARAVENMVYVVLSGNVGNLPQVDNFLINYGEAIICTPSDFSFPPDAIAAKADFNTETVVISDLDLGTLEQVRELGSVRPLRDRRPDLYTISAKVPVEVVRTV